VLVVTKVFNTERRTRFVERIRPSSWSALLVVTLCLAAATLLRIALSDLGLNALFPTYYPAVLLAALLAGTLAGIGVIVGAIVIAWWAFIPPPYQFSPLTNGELANLVLFAASSGCLVVMSHLYRDVLFRLRRRDRERELLLQELQHRGRNTYAVVESIVRHTLVNDPASADAIAGRVRAVSSANDLINQSDTKTVDLRSLLMLEFAPATQAQLRTTGTNIALTADVARKLGLVFHELVTNAMKHGALSSPRGRVVVTWQADSDSVRLKWREEDGPAVLPPQRQGFGTVIVTQSLKSLSGGITSAFEPSGLDCDIHFKCRQ
jgi:two-component sensor histidine kinase